MATETMATEPIAPEGSLLPLLEEGRPTSRGWVPRLITVGGIVVLLLVISALDLSLLRTDWISLGLIYVLAGISLNILMGYAGQVSLGHQAFVGIGAFTSAILVSKAGVSFWLAVPLSAVTGGLIAIGLGFVALRLAGLYLALITLAYGQITEEAIFKSRAITGGGTGVEAPRPAGFESNFAYVILILMFIGLAYYVDWRFRRSKTGRAVFAIRENEIAAASFGINVVSYKLLAFVLSGAIAGVAGALLAHRTTRVDASVFDFNLALIFVLMVAVGGLGSRAGVFMASFTFAVLPLVLVDFAKYVLAIEASLLLVTLILNPGGIAQLIRPVTDWIGGKPFTMKHQEGGVQAGGAGVRP